MKIMTTSGIISMLKKADVTEIMGIVDDGGLELATLHIMSHAMKLAGYNNPAFDGMTNALEFVSDGYEEVYDTYVDTGFIVGSDKKTNDIVQASFDAFLNPKVRPTPSAIGMLGQSASRLLENIESDELFHQGVLDAVGEDGIFDTMVSCVVQITWLLNRQAGDAVARLRLALMEKLPDYGDIFATRMVDDSFVGENESTIATVEAVLNAVGNYRKNATLKMIESLFSEF